MTGYVLDTDTLSLLQRGNPVVGAHVRRRADEVATTIVSVEEQLSGWYALLRRAKTARQLVPVYQRMQDTIRFSELPPDITVYRSGGGQIRRAAQSVATPEPHGPPHRGRCDDVRCGSCHAQPSRFQIDRRLGRRGLEPELTCRTRSPLAHPSHSGWSRGCRVPTCHQRLEPHRVPRRFSAHGAPTAHLLDVVSFTQHPWPRNDE